MYILLIKLRSNTATVKKAEKSGIIYLPNMRTLIEDSRLSHFNDNVNNKLIIIN